MIKFHPFHIVNIRPWPLVSSLSFLRFTISIIFYTQFKINYLWLLAIISLIICSYQWWRDTLRESSYEGYHGILVINGIKIGIILFITSEIFFFVSFFWGYFHVRSRPNIELGQTWPPISIVAFNPINVPLLNTIVLISSGASITWSHHEILKNNYGIRNLSLIITIILGLYFSFLQGIEYWRAEFTICDSVYGSTFFIATGFHGLHVLLGTSFLIISYNQLSKKNTSHLHFIGFELAAWYWHFVDIVWLFLYLSIYWWGMFF